MFAVVYVRAEIIGKLPSGQKRVHLLANGADGISFYTDNKSIVYDEALCRVRRREEKRFVASQECGERDCPLYGGACGMNAEALLCSMPFFHPTQYIKSS